MWWFLPIVAIRLLQNNPCALCSAQRARSGYSHPGRCGCRTFHHDRSHKIAKSQSRHGGVDMSTTCLRDAVLRSRRCKQDRARYTRLFGSLVLATSTMALVSCAGYVPGRQAYWDAQVKEMCEKDGGVRIFELLHISEADIEFLGRVDGRIAVPAKRVAHPKSPVFAENKITYIRQSNPAVWRSEWVVRRRVDLVIVARWTSYVRVGGDVPSDAHPSSFSCPNPETITSNLQKLFVVQWR